MASVELQKIKDIAAKLGVEHSPNIGIETLKGKIQEFCTSTGVELHDEVLEGIFLEKDIMNNQGEISEMSQTSVNPSQVETKNKSTTEIEKLKTLTFAGAAEAHAKEEKQTAYKRAMKLVRVRVSCNNPNKRSYQGEIFCVRNKAIDMVKKFVPFNTPTHVPQIILNMISEKQLQQFTSKRLPNGIETKSVKLVPEYNIEELAPLTTEEFNAIRQKQLAEGNE